MSKLQKISLICIAALAVCARLYADPINFMVGDYVFPRPEAWKWIPLNDKAKISAHLSATNQEANLAADIVFLESKASGGWASATETIGRWKKNFEEPDHRQNQRQEEYTFGQIKVTYFWQEGTYRTALGGDRYRSEGGFAQYGVVIEDGKNNILARVLGKKYAVEKCKDDFKRVIEDALQEGKS